MDGNTPTIRVINSIYLFIMSILKTLSGNITTLLILFILIYIVCHILISRVITLPCSNCSRGSWWYKCLPRTGYGSNTCRSFNEILDKTEDVIMIFVNIKEKFYNILYTLLEHNHNILKKYFIYLDDMMYAILQLNPAYLLVELIYKQVLTRMFSVMKAIISKVAQINLGIRIPWINFNLSLSEILIKIMDLVMNLIKKMFTLFLKLFVLIANLIWKFVLSPIFSALLILIKNFRDIIFNIFNSLISELNFIVVLIKRPFEILRSITINDIFTLIFDNILGTILPLIGISKQLISLVPLILITLIVLSLIGMILIPLLGILFASSGLLKSILYLFLSCDDDEDFRLIIFNIINNIYSI